MPSLIAHLHDKPSHVCIPNESQLLRSASLTSRAGGGWRGGGGGGVLSSLSMGLAVKILQDVT